MKVKVIAVLITFFVIIFTGCKGNVGRMNQIKLTSPAFGNMKTVPVKYTGFGKDLSIPLNWDNIPADAKSIAIVMDDPDAPIGTFTHWIIFNIHPDENSLPEGIPQKPVLSGGAKQGRNDFGRIGYNGPMPPAGKVHHYRITIYALDTVLDLDAGIKAKEFHRAIKGHILAQGLLTGLYKR